MSMGNAEWAQQVPPQDISSIHLLSPSPEKGEQQEILEHCRDTTKLVNQLTTALRGLQADVSSLRRENQSLRQTMFTALPPDQVQQLLQQAESSAAAAEAPAPTPPAPPEPVVSGGFLSSGSSSPACCPGLSLGPGLCAQATQQRSAPPLQSARQSTPPPTARLAQSTLTARERIMHASPHFGQTPGPWPSPLNSSLAGSSQQPRTPSPSSKRPSQGQPPPRPGFAADGLQGSPHQESTATIIGVQDPSAVPTSVEAREAPEVVAPWGVDQTFWLGQDVNLPQVASKVRILDRESIISVNAAVEGLNRGAFKLADDVCVVYSASNRGFFLLYRHGHRDKACNVAMSLTPRVVEESTDFMPPSRADEAAGNAGGTSGGTTPTVPVNVSLAATPEVPSMLATSMEPGPPALSQAGEPWSGVHEAGTGEIALSSPVVVGGPSSAASTPPSRGGSLSGTVLVHGPGQEQQPQQPQQQPPPQQQMLKDPLASIEELAAQGNIAKAEELLSQTTRSGGRPSEACFDVLIQAFDRDKQCAKAEEWLLRACELGCQPSEASFFTVIASLCQLGSLSRAEELTLQMMRSRIRPSKELFNMIIQLFAEQCDAPKVEEWLLNAGQSGWTPEQAAFDSVVLLWAEVDALKAEEWLSRGQQTEYRLPDECYGAVVKAFLRAGNSSKVNEWLSRMLGENRVPSDSLLHEVISLHIETGDIPRAEAWLTQLAGRSSTSVDGLRTALFDVAMRTGDIVYAERQLAALGEADAERTMQAVSVLMDRGDAARAKVLCERYRSLGGAPNLDICNALLYACSATGDAAGAERAVRALASAEPLTESQAALLRRAVGDDRAADLLDELCGVEDAGLPPGAQTEQPAQAPGLHRERSPTTLPSMTAQASSGAPKTSIGDRSSAKKTAPPSSTSGRTPASKAASVASAKAQARRGPSTSGAGAATARTRPMR